MLAAIANVPLPLFSYQSCQSTKGFPCGELLLYREEQVLFRGILKQIVHLSYMNYWEELVL